MRRVPVFLFFFLCVAAVTAHSGPLDGIGDPQQSVRDQRRVQLREVLRTERRTGPDSDTATVTVVAPPSRHLSPQERFELREQLRREQNESRGIRR
jgi:hypothetical protein